MITLENLNKVTPYRVEEGLQNTLLFSNRMGIDYEVTLIEDNGTLNGLPSLQLSFYPKTERDDIPYDENVNITLIRIIEYILKQDENVILYITDNRDDRGVYRYRLFKRWFSRNEPIYEGKYILKTIQDRAGVILSSNNPRKEEYLTAVDEINAELEK